MNVYQFVTDIDRHTLYFLKSTLHDIRFVLCCAVCVLVSLLVLRVRFGIWVGFDCISSFSLPFFLHLYYYYYRCKYKDNNNKQQINTVCVYKPCFRS